MRIILFSNGYCQHIRYCKYGIFAHFIEQLLAGGGGGLELGTNIVGYSEYTNDNKWEARYKSVEATYGQNSDVGLALYQDDNFLEDISVDTCGSVVGKAPSDSCNTGPYKGDNVDDYSSRIYRDLPSEGGDFFSLKDWKHSLNSARRRSAEFMLNAGESDPMYMAISDAGLNNYYANENLKAFYLDFSELNADSYIYDVNLDEGNYVNFSTASISGNTEGMETAVSKTSIFNGATDSSFIFDTAVTTASSIVTTNGTSFSSSISDTVRPSVNISNATAYGYKGYANEFQIAVGVEYEKSWQDTTSVDFSQAESKENSQTYSFIYEKSYYTADTDVLLDQITWELGEDDDTSLFDPSLYVVINGTTYYQIHEHLYSGDDTWNAAIEEGEAAYGETQGSAVINQYHDYEHLDPYTGVTTGLLMFIGKQYRNTIYSTQSSVDTTLQGQYDITIEDLGSVANRYDTEYSGTDHSIDASHTWNTFDLSEAITLSSDNDGMSVLDYDNTSFQVNADGANTVSFQGEANANTITMVDFYEEITEASETTASTDAALIALQDLHASALQSNPKTSAPHVGALASITNGDSLGLTNVSGYVRDLDMALIDNFKTTNVPQHLSLYALEGDLNRVKGSGNKSRVDAAEEGQHIFTEFKDSILHGNDESDLFELSTTSKNNKIFAKGGDDVVEAKSSQQANLGSGSDTYKLLGGQNHNIQFGEGADKLIIDKAGKHRFEPSNFDIFSDKITVGKKLDKSLLTAVMAHNYLDNADKSSASGLDYHMHILYDDIVIGDVYFNKSKADSEFFDIFNNIDMADNLFLNPRGNRFRKALKALLTDRVTLSSAERVDYLIGTNVWKRYAFMPDEWTEASPKEKAERVYPAMKRLGLDTDKAEFVSSLQDFSAEDLKVISDSEFDLFDVAKIFSSYAELDWKECKFGLNS